MSAKRKDTIFLDDSEESGSDWEQEEYKSKAKRKSAKRPRKSSAGAGSSSSHSRVARRRSSVKTEPSITFITLFLDACGLIASMLSLKDFIKLRTVSRLVTQQFGGDLSRDYFRAFFARDALSSILPYSHPEANFYLHPFRNRSSSLRDWVFGQYHGTALQLAWLKRIITNNVTVQTLICAFDAGKLTEEAILKQPNVRCALCRGSLPVWPICTYDVSTAGFGGGAVAIMHPLDVDDLSKRLFKRLLVCNKCTARRNDICIDTDSDHINTLWRFPDAVNNQFVRQRLPTFGGRLLIEDLNMLWDVARASCDKPGVANRSESVLLAGYEWPITRQYPPGSRLPNGVFLNDPVPGQVLKPDTIASNHKEMMALWVALPEALRKTHKIVVRVEYTIEDAEVPAPAAAAVAAVAGNNQGQHLDIEDEDV